jgi:flagellar biosynthesis protein FliQ
MSKNNSKDNKIALAFSRFLFSFFLALCFVIFSVSVIARVVISEKSINRVIFRDSTYCELLMEEIGHRASDYTIPTGIDTKVTEQIFDINEIEKDVRESVHAAFIGSDYVPDTSALEKRVADKAYAFYEEQGEVTEETMEVIDAYASDIASLYSQSLKIVGLNYICQANKTYSKFFPAFLVLFIIALYFLGWMCMKLQDFPHRGLRYISYASGGAALLLFIAPYLLYQSKIYERINIVHYPLYYLATNYIKDSLFLFFIASAAMLVLTVLLIVIIAIMKKKLS